MTKRIYFLTLFASVAGLLAQAPAARPAETTPLTLPGAETFIYREGAAEPMRVHVFKPAGWRAGDRRGALLWFFGGGWTTGTPANSVWWASWAADHGLVGFAPDYRTKGRFGTPPQAAVADARAVLHWVEEHAGELGIDPRRIAVGGNSAGGHVALWTAIAQSPPGSAAGEAPRFKPRALVLTSAVSDTSPASGYTPQRFGAEAGALSPVHQLDAKMPPMLVFHGDADKTVPQAQSLALRDRLRAAGNGCEFVNVPGGSHNFAGELPEWREKMRAMTEEFLRRQGVIGEP